MQLVSDNQQRPFKLLLDAYHQCFYNRDIDALTDLYVSDGAVVYFDNHASCDSRTLNDQLEKVSHFFETGDIVKLEHESIDVHEYTDSAVLLTKVRYSNRPDLGVRASFFLEKQDGHWKIRHIHYSSDPNDEMQLES